MMPATAPVARRRPTLKCCRCGLSPRMVLEDGPIFLCAVCRFEGKPEADMALQASADRPRLWLMQHFGWRGGW